MQNNNMENNNVANNNMLNNKYVFRIGSSTPTTSETSDEKSTKKEISNKVSKKTGRPIKVPSRCKTKYVKVFCTEEDYQDFRKYCDDMNSSGSELLYRYLKRLIRNNKKI